MREHDGIPRHQCSSASLLAALWGSLGGQAQVDSTYYERSSPVTISQILQKIPKTWIEDTLPEKVLKPPNLLRQGRR